MILGAERDSAAFLAQQLPLHLHRLCLRDDLVQFEAYPWRSRRFLTWLEDFALTRAVVRTTLSVLEKVLQESGENSLITEVRSQIFADVLTDWDRKAEEKFYKICHCVNLMGRIRRLPVVWEQTYLLYEDSKYHHRDYIYLGYR